MSNLYEVQDLNISDLVAPKWAAVYTLRPEKIQIRSSIQKHGILAPVVVQQDTGVIIDGKTRVETAYELGWRQVPATVVPCSEVEAMILHVRLNRYRGTVVARRLSAIIRRILASGAYSEDELRNTFAMSHDEFDVLADGTILKHRNISEHTYSAAWVPIESASGHDVRIERPTGLPEQKG